MNISPGVQENLEKLGESPAVFPQRSGVMIGSLSSLFTEEEDIQEVKTTLSKESSSSFLLKESKERHAVSEDQLIHVGDFKSLRNMYTNKILNTFQSHPSVDNSRYSLSYSDIQYKPPKDTSFKAQHKAILTNTSLDGVVRGKINLLDKTTGKTSSSSLRTFMKIPYLTERGTFIRGGIEYTFPKQFRLSPGVYTRKTADDKLEAQFNIKPGTGLSFRLHYDPPKALFSLKWGGKTLPLYSVLKSSGMSDDKIKKAWPGVFDINKEKTVSSHFSKWLEDIRNKVEQDSSLSNLYRFKKGTDNSTSMESVSYITKGSIIADLSEMENYSSTTPLTNLNGLVAGDAVGSSNAYIQRNKAGSPLLIAYKNIPRNTPIHYNPVDEMTQGVLREHEKEAGIQESSSPYVRKYMAKMQIDPDISEEVLGERHSYISPELLLKASSVLLNKYKNNDNNFTSRDSLKFQKVYDYGDFVADHIKLDKGGVVRNLLWKLTNKQGDLSKITTNPFQSYINDLFNSSQLAQTIESINPVQTYVDNFRITRLGEGGIVSLDSAPDSAREVNPSYAGFVDPVKTKESARVGLDSYLAKNARIGPNNLLYTKLINNKTGVIEWIDNKTAAKANIAFPDTKGGHTLNKYIPAILDDDVNYISRDDVDYTLPSGNSLLSISSLTIPMASGVKGLRLIMGSKYPEQAIPLLHREVPLVQTDLTDNLEKVSNILGTAQGEGEGVFDHLGQFTGALHSPEEGVVQSISPDYIKIKDKKGTVHNMSLYNNFALPSNTFIQNIAQVKKGDVIKKNQLLASSNFTDNKGTFAPGINFKIAYMPYKGLNYEDSMVISQNAADKLQSSLLYGYEVDKGPGDTLTKKAFLNRYPSTYSKKQHKKIGDNGVVRVGQVVEEGDPLILKTHSEEPSLSTLGRKIMQNKAQEWEHSYKGLITDVVPTKEGYKIKVRAKNKIKQADKIALPFGAKGVIGKIVPNTEMIKDEKGEPIDVILSPNTLISRTNFAQVPVAALGKVAMKTGKPYALSGFQREDLPTLAQKELDKHGVKTNERVFDPTSGKYIDDIFVGNSYLYRLHHTSEKKLKGRGEGQSFTQEGVPSKGGAGGAKHIGDLDLHALLGHNAMENIKDIKLIKGNRNDNFWRQLKMGVTPTMPETPYAYKKLINHMKAAGINVEEGATSDNIFAMTNNKVKELTKDNELQNADTFQAKSFKPIKGGLFSKVQTGFGIKGDKFSYYTLPEPFLNPLMEGPVKALLGLTGKEFRKEMAKGGKKLKETLSKLDLSKKKKEAIYTYKNGSTSNKDLAVKQLGYITAMQNQGVTPDEFMWDRLPVLPPEFRPISKMGDTFLVSDMNSMYKAFHDTLRDFKDSKVLPEEMQTNALLSVYDSMKAITGYKAPDQPALSKKNIGGIFKQLFGNKSPKLGFVQRRLIGTNIGNMGLGVITPDPTLKLSQVGIPLKNAFEVYAPFVVRNMVKHGYKAGDAVKEIKKKSEKAEKALRRVIKERPVLLNRAPTLHKYNIQAFYPVLHNDNDIKINPAICGSQSADFDGDLMSYSVPVSAKAVEEAKQKLLPTNFLLGSRKDNPLFTMTQEYLQGLYYASKGGEGNSEVFDNIEAAQEAYKKGDIKIDTPIRIRNVN